MNPLKLYRKVLTYWTMLAWTMIIAPWGWQNAYTQSDTSILKNTKPCFSDELLASRINDEPLFQNKIDQIENTIFNYLTQVRTGSIQPPPPTTYYIPVVVHVVHDPADAVVGVGSNISDEQVYDQIHALNHEFNNGANTPSPAVNTNIKFCLATKKNDGTPFNGITRIASPLANHDYRTDKIVLKTLDNVPADFPSEKYLNIWIVINRVMN